MSGNARKNEGVGRVLGGKGRNREEMSRKPCSKERHRRRKKCIRMQRWGHVLSGGLDEVQRIVGYRASKPQQMQAAASNQRF